MYTRDYYPDAAEKINLPKNYDGTAFITESARTDTENTDVQGAAADLKETPREEAETAGGFGSTFSIFKKLPFSDLLGGALAKLHIKDFKLGAEEILLLGVAVFLFVSHEGDRELGLMLLLLLFVR